MLSLALRNSSSWLSQLSPSTSREHHWIAEFFAYATDLVFSIDPLSSRYDVATMRKHLEACLKAGAMKPFPQLQDKLRLQAAVSMPQNFEVELLNCFCRMLQQYVMDLCDRCGIRFHARLLILCLAASSFV